MSAFVVSQQPVLVFAEVATIGALLVLVRRSWRRRSDDWSWHRRSDESFAHGIAALESAIVRNHAASRSRGRPANVVRLDEYRARRAFRTRSTRNAVAPRPFDGTPRTRRTAPSGGSVDRR